MTMSLSSVSPPPVEGGSRSGAAIGSFVRTVGSFVTRWLPAGVVIAGLLLLWEWAGASGRLPVSVPAPSEIGTEFLESNDMLWFHTAPTLSAAVKGFVAASVTAFMLGMLVAFRPRFASPVYQTSVIVSSVPLVALTPVLVLWLERGDTVRTTVAALAGFFPILVGCVQGFGNRDTGRDELFHVLSAGPWQRFVSLTLPSSQPYVFAGLKAAAASAVLGAIIAEWSGGGGTRGLGQMMTNALFGFNVPRTWLTITTAAFLAVAAYAIVATVDRALGSRHRGGQADGDTGFAATRPVDRATEPDGARPVVRMLRALGRSATVTVVAFGGVVLIWWSLLAIFDVPSYFMPGPGPTLQTLVTERSQLGTHAQVTLLGTAAGVVVATVIAVVLAMIFVTSAHLERALLPLAITFRSIPIVAIAPLVTLMVGRGFATNIVCVTIVCFFPMLVNTARGLRAMTPEMHELMRVSGAARLQTFRYVRFPVMTPYLLAGLRSAAAVAVLGAMLAEWLTGQQGLGYLLIAAVALRDNELLWSVVIVSSACSLAFFALMQGIERVFVGWSTGERS